MISVAYFRFGAYGVTLNARVKQKAKGRRVSRARLQWNLIEAASPGAVRPEQRPFSVLGAGEGGFSSNAKVPPQGQVLRPCGLPQG